MKLSKKYLVVLAFGISLSTIPGCSTGEWFTDYSDVIDPAASKNWQIHSIDVRVPNTLTVSEENIFAPSSDIVWREDPIGNRLVQVDAIMTEAAKRGTSGLSGSQRVNLVITVTQFHALTEKTRFTLRESGVHNIGFLAQVFDAKSGKQLTPIDQIDANLIGLTGPDAIAAIAEGQTQKVRIIDHVSKVIAGWLQIGPDVRGSFLRSGR